MVRFGAVMRTLGSLLLLPGLVLAGCGGGGDEGDPVAFCDLLRGGAGFDTTDLAGLDALSEVAPVDIRPAVSALRNTSRRLEDIPDEKLDELFAAATDPEAGQARTDLEQYAVEQCGLEPRESGVEPGTLDRDAALRDLSTYIDENFGTTDWADQLEYGVAFEFGRLDSVSATFAAEPGGNAPLEACNALSVYLYTLQGGTGDVTIRGPDGVLMSRQGPDERCQQP